MKNKRQIVYIVGYGRSGSTVLDLALSAIADNAIGLGEVGSLISRVSLPRIGCSCGLVYRDCPVWEEASEFILSLPKTLVRSFVLHDSLLGLFSRSDAHAYGEFWDKILSLREAQTHRFASVMIDSTKTAYLNMFRPLRLVRSGRFEVFIVHVHRPLFDVLHARARGSNAKLSGKLADTSWGQTFFDSLWPIRTVLGWCFANLVAAIVKRSKKFAGYVDVEFSEIEESAEECAVRVLNRANSVLSTVIPFHRTADGFAHPDHIVEGNRLAANGSVFIRGMREPNLGIPGL